jgi:hypothetical protein
MKTSTSAEQALQNFLQFGTLLGGASLFPDQWSSWRQPQARNDNVPLPASYPFFEPPAPSPTPGLPQKVDYEKAYVDCFVHCGLKYEQGLFGRGSDVPQLHKKCLRECMEEKGYMLREG